MTGVPSHEHNDTFKASGQIDKRRDKGAADEWKSSGELCVIEDTCCSLNTNFSELITFKMMVDGEIDNLR